MQISKTIKTGTARKLLPALIITLTMVFTAAAVLAPAAESGPIGGIEYLDMSGVAVNTDTLPGHTVTELLSSADFVPIGSNFALDETVTYGWYFVAGDFTLPGDLIIPTGSAVNIIIGNSYTLTITGKVTVHANAGLNIYTQDPVQTGLSGIGTIEIGGGIEYLGVHKGGATVPFINTAHIIITGSGVSGIYVSSANAFTLKLHNGASGVISSIGRGLELNVGAGTEIVNRGVIAGDGSHGIEIIGAAGSSASIINEGSGSISGATNGINIRCPGVTVDNYGAIAGSSGGVSGSGINSTNANTTVANFAGAAINGKDNGIFLRSTGGKVDNRGLIAGYYGIRADYSATIENDGDGLINGIIEGAQYGLFITNFTGSDYIANYGRIEATNLSTGNGIYIGAGNNTISNGVNGTNIGKIKGGFSGILLEAGGKVDNKGQITGVIYGIFSYETATVVNDGDGITTGVIRGNTGISLLYFSGIGGAGDLITNYGLIEGTNFYGIYIHNGIDILVTNGISAGGNVGTIKGTSSYSAVNVTAAPADFVNKGTVDGNVVLGNHLNNVTLWAGSSITGTLTMGTDAGTLLKFEGTPTGTPLKYATVGGTVNLGSAAVSFKDLPAGYSPGLGSITLIEITSASGAFSGAPANSTHATIAPDPAHTFSISVQNKVLVAAPMVSAQYLKTDFTSDYHNVIVINQSYFGASGVSGSLKDTSGVTGTDGTWYYVAGNIDLSALSITGDVSIIIGNNNILTAANGVTLNAAGDKLGLYSQPLGAGEAMGELRATGASGHAVNLNVATTLDNTASINATGTGSYGVNIAAVSTVTNSGKIAGTSAGINSAAPSAIVFNYGKDPTYGMIKGAAGISFSVLSAGGISQVTNSGLIEGTAGPGISFGKILLGSLDVLNSVSLSGNIGRIIGTTDGIKLDAGSITNGGYIEGGSNGIYTGASVSITNNAGNGTTTGVIKGGTTGVYIGNFDGTPGGDAFVNRGLIQGTAGYGVRIVNGSSITIENKTTGSITGGTSGVYFQAEGIVYNEGHISGGADGGVQITARATVVNYAGDGVSTGLITSTGHGVSVYSGTVNNYGKITGTGATSYGVYTNTSITLLNQGNGTSTGVIIGNGIGVVYVNFNGVADTFTNEGLIEGTLGGGVFFTYGSDILITNTGEIKGPGTGGFGVYVQDGTGSTEIKNNGGIISGQANGIYLARYGVVKNYETAFGIGVITGTAATGVRLYNGGEVYNYGRITGGQYGIYSGNDSLIVANDGDGLNTGVIEGTADIGICSDDVALIINNNNGLITGAYGIYVGYLDSDNGYMITNFGTVKATSGNGISVADGDCIIVTNFGKIDAGLDGIRVFNGTETYLYNDGEIDSTIYGILVYYSQSILIENNDIITAGEGIRVNEGDYISIYNVGTIDTGGYAICVNGGNEINIFNIGAIENAEAGIWVEGNGGTVWIENTGTGEIEADIGIGVWDYEVIDVINDGVITSSDLGIGLNSSGRIENNGTVTADIGIILVNGGSIENNGTVSGTSTGIWIQNGGDVYNKGGEISGGTDGIYTEGSVYIEQYALITGNVILTNDVNYVLFASGSVIDGDFRIGSNPSSFIKFIDVLDPVTLTYASITGSTDIGNKTAEVYIFVVDAMLPAGFTIGDKIILIDGGATGTVVTVPANATYTEDGKFFRIYVKDNKLIAELSLPGKDYYITASADAKTSISPAGTVIVQGGTSAKFTFSAAAGSFVGAVIVDGVYLSQAEIDKGYYTFRDVKSNHSIQVTGREPRTGITLTVNVAEGKGYAEYSVDGGPFAKYTSAVPISEGAEVTLRAVANDGYEFVEWRKGADIFPISPMTFPDNRANLEVSLYFEGDDSGTNYLLLYLPMIILVLLVIVVVAFLLKGGKKG